MFSLLLVALLVGVGHGLTLHREQCTAVHVQTTHNGIEADFMVQASESVAFPPGNTDLLVTMVRANISVHQISFYDVKLDRFVPFANSTTVPNVDALRIAFDGTDIGTTFGLSDGMIYAHNRFLEPDHCTTDFGSGTKICCLQRYVFIDYPIPEDTCTAFTTETAITSAVGNTTVTSFRTDVQLSAKAITATVTQLTSAPTDTYDFGHINAGPSVQSDTGSTVITVPIDAHADGIDDLTLRVRDAKGTLKSESRVIAVTRRGGNVYLNSQDTPTRANPCVTRFEGAGTDRYSYSTACCKRFQPNPNAVPKCAAYRLLATVKGADNRVLNFLNSTLTFVDKSLNVAVTNFTSALSNKTERGEILMSAQDGHAQGCPVNSRNPNTRSVFTLTDDAKYQFALRTDSFPAGFNLFAAVKRLQQFVVPSFNSGLCHTETNPGIGASSNATVASTQFCCILEKSRSSGFFDFFKRA